jgi:hypothetical protein
MKMSTGKLMKKMVHCYVTFPRAYWHIWAYNGMEPKISACIVIIGLHENKVSYNCQMVMLMEIK